MWVQSLGWEGPLEKGMATHSSILAWRIPWTKEPGRLCSIGSKRVRHDSGDLAHTPTKYVLRRATNCLPQSSLRKKKKTNQKAIQRN